MHEPLECCRCIIHPKQRNTILKESKAYLLFSSILMTLGYSNLMVALDEVNLAKDDCAS